MNESCDKISILEKFWKETCKKYYDSLCEVDKEDYQNPQNVSEFAEECC